MATRLCEYSPYKKDYVTFEDHAQRMSKNGVRVTRPSRWSNARHTVCAHECLLCKHKWKVTPNTAARRGLKCPACDGPKAMSENSQSRVFSFVLHYAAFDIRGVFHQKVEFRQGEVERCPTRNVLFSTETPTVQCAADCVEGFKKSIPRDGLIPSVKIKDMTRFIQATVGRLIMPHEKIRFKNVAGERRFG